MIDYSNLLFSGGAHACIYSKQFINNIINYNKKIDNWDYFINWNYFGKRYMHNKLLCYQLFPETTNSKEWYGQNNLKFLESKTNGYPLLNFLELDKRHDIGYPFFYTMSTVIFIIILFFSIRFIYNKIK